MPKTFPHAATLLCYFHLTQAVLRYAHNTCHLKGQMTEEPDMRKCVMTLCALAFVPVREQWVVFTQIRANYDQYPAIAPVVQYFCVSVPICVFTNYMQRVYLGKDENDADVTPQFAPALWNKCESVMASWPRTNNGVEGLNASVSKHFRQRTPSFMMWIQRAQVNLMQYHLNV